MIYFDYAANTPADERVLEAFCRVTREFYGNPNSPHSMGLAAKERINAAIDGILSCFNAEDAVLTSGASESNNLAIKGLAEAYKENGRHIISTCLEHSSVSGALTYLQTQGYEIDLVDIKKDGQVDLEHLRELMRNDTVLVSICSVDSELGIVQPIDKIAEIVREYPNCFFHTDATQAIGKVRLDFSDIDLVTFTPHKFYGLNGSGVLLKKKDVVLKPLINGGISTTIYRSGTPVTAQAAAAQVALQLAMEEFDERNRRVKELNDYLRNGLKKYTEVIFNTRERTLPHFINISVKGIKASQMQEELNKRGICVSTKSACSVPNTPSRAVYAITHDRKTALSSWRISLSHLTEFEELDEFLKVFEEIISGKI
ncbi:MAG: cysteine desulfurase family protein [Candidatus Ornithomonoglobus sp.]